jgi:lipid A 3-O-deacylase
MNKPGAGIRLISCLLFLISFTTASLAQSPLLEVSSISFSGGVGHRPEGLQIYRLGLQWDWEQCWFNTAYAYLTGYWDLDFTYMHANSFPRSNDNVATVSFVPMFRIQMHPFSNTIAPFFQGGVGPALVTHVNFGNINISTAYQFDDRVGFGIRFGGNQQYELSYMYNHLSNAGIKKPNPGIDASMLLTFKYYF